MNFRRSSYLSSKQNQTACRFTATVTKILRWMFLLLLCFSFLNSTSLCQLGAATLPNRIAYDFDGNGISDLLWRDTQTGDLAIWLMDGTARASKTFVFPRVDPSWQIAGVGDLDGDGRADLVWRNTQSGGVAEWLMDGTTLKAWSTLLSGLDQAWQISGVGDLDGDGKADLMWRNMQSGEVVEWLMNGAALKSWSSVSSGVDLTWKIAGIIDLDGDGKSDLIWRNTQSGEVAEWLMNGDTLKSWSTIEPGSQWANKPFTPILADHMEVSQFRVDLTAVTFNQRTIYEYLPKLRLTEMGGKIGISVSVRLSANSSSLLTPPFVRRVEAGTAKEVLNDESGFVAFGGSISSITAQISYTDDAGRSGYQYRGGFQAGIAQRQIDRPQQRRNRSVQHAAVPETWHLRSDQGQDQNHHG
jgi:FG-GAP-like repeat